MLSALYIFSVKYVVTEMKKVLTVYPQLLPCTGKCHCFHIWCYTKFNLFNGFVVLKVQFVKLSTIFDSAVFNLYRVQMLGGGSKKFCTGIHLKNMPCKVTQILNKGLHVLLAQSWPQILWNTKSTLLVAQALQMFFVNYAALILWCCIVPFTE